VEKRSRRKVLSQVKAQKSVGGGETLIQVYSKNRQISPQSAPQKGEKRKSRSNGRKKAQKVKLRNKDSTLRPLHVQRVRNTKGRGGKEISSRVNGGFKGKGPKQSTGRETKKSTGG